MQMTCIEADYSSFQFFKAALLNIIDFQNKFINDKFSITLPFEPLPPSYQFPDDSQRRTDVKMSYIIRFEVKMKSIMCINFYFDVPFLLGTHSQLPSDHQSILNSKMISNFSKDPM